MMMDVNQDNDSDRTESYTPPPLDITNDFNSSSEKENSSPNKQQSIIVLDESFDQSLTTKQINTKSPSNSFFSFSTKRRFLSFFFQSIIIGINGHWLPMN